jgi:membrane protease YdiL (CAAX protease family)
MSFPLRTSDSFEPPREFRWTKLDLAVFALFFAMLILFLPIGMIQIMRMFRPNLTVADLTGIEQVLLQGVMDVLLIAFIFFMIKVVHGLSFLETIKWTRNHQFRTGFLIAAGAALAVSVLIVSSVFPPSEPPPIEKLITSTGALYLFVLFGVGVAPAVEEIIFRGFLFRVFEDVGSQSLAVPATAILFTILHVPQLWGSWAGIFLILVVGYVLSIARQRSNSLIPPFIIHTAYNGMLFAVYAIGTLAQQTLKR